MNTIDRYIAREIFLSWLTVLLVLLVIVLSTEVVHLLSWITQGIIPVNAFISYLMNSLFEFSVVLIPLSLLIGILTGFGRLYRDSEMTAIMAAGIGPMQWYKPLLVVVVPVTVLLTVLMLFARPAISYQRAEITAKLDSQAEVDTLLVGQFNRASKGNAVLFLESQSEDKKHLKNTFFEQYRERKHNVDIAASTSSFRSDAGRRYMVMHNGVHYAGNAGEAEMKIIEYGEYGIYIDHKTPAVHVSTESKHISELLASESLEDKAEFQWRLAIPIATFIVSLLALPLSKTDPRSGRYSKLAIALVLYLLYSNMLNVSTTWIEQGKVPLWLGTWWVHGIAIIFLYIVMKHSGYIARQKRVVQS